MTRLATMTGACLLWATAAHAQTCLGTLTFANAPTQIGGNAFFDSASTGFNVGAAKGFSGQYFGRVGVGIEKVSDVDGLAKNISLNAGGEVAAGSDKKFSVCPVVGFFKRFGPDPGLNLSESSYLFSGGVSVGYVAKSSGTTDIVPFGGLALNHTSLSISGTGFSNNAFTDNFAALNVGVGIILDKRQAITPSIVLPFSQDTDTVFQVSYSRSFGK